MAVDVNALRRSIKHSLFRRWQMIIIAAFLAYRLARGETGHSTLFACGVWLATLGFAMNLIVILANGGMPARVLDEEIPDTERDDYQVMSESTRFACLADWIPLGNLLISPGDIVLTLAIALILLDRVVGPEGGYAS